MAKKVWAGKYEMKKCRWCMKKRSATNMAAHISTTCTGIIRNRERPFVPRGRRTQANTHQPKDKVGCLYCGNPIRWASMARHVNRHCKSAGVNVCEFADCEYNGDTLTARHREVHDARVKEGEHQRRGLKLAEAEKKLEELMEALGVMNRVFSGSQAIATQHVNPSATAGLAPQEDAYNPVRGILHPSA
jgi:hypothetical protein